MITILKQRRFRMYKSIDLFAGIGGIRKGFDRAFGKKIKTVFVSEWDEFAQKTYKMNYHDKFDIAGDITQIDEKEKKNHIQQNRIKKRKNNKKKKKKKINRKEKKKKRMNS